MKTFPLYAYLQRSGAVLTLLLLMLAGLAACAGDDDPTSPQVPSTAVDSSTADTTTSTQNIELTVEEQSETLPGRLLFVENGTIRLWEGQQTRSIPVEGTAWQPEWSPDGRRIAYVERGESYSDILLTTPNGNQQDRLTRNSSEFPPRSHERIYDSMWAFYPTWSPDGETLVMASQYSTPIPGDSAIEYNLSLFRIPLETEQREQLYANDNAHTITPTYTPDGNAIVYTNISLRGDGQQQLYRLDLDTGEVAAYPGAPIRSYDPAFSPDGNWLAFVARNNERTDIWALPGNASDGSDPRPQRLTDLGMVRAPAFSPDGSMLAFLALPAGGQWFELWVTDLESNNEGVLLARNARQLTTGMQIDPDSGLSWTQ